MERVNRILQHPLYRQCLQEISELEKGRRFCGHDMAHFLDVARIAYLLSLKEQAALCKETVYAAALLHDIGRHLQYREGTPHEQASAQLARQILKDCGFSGQESEEIAEAILRHRDAEAGGEKTLAGYLWRGDKLSRSCFCCAAEKECSWAPWKKNKKLTY